ncbi:hypothetical protein [Mycobacterium lepromatosis]|nr:hypothetical protein [Mycobacterium lepromatosis]
MLAVIVISTSTADVQKAMVFAAAHQLKVPHALGGLGVNYPTCGPAL